MSIFGFRRSAPLRQAGRALYAAAVAAARTPAFYLDFGVPDTFDGRFDMVGLHAFLLIRRLTAAPPPGPELAQAVFDAMFEDMDRTLREIGVGDLSVAKKNRAMWNAFHGRALAYQEAIAAGEPALEAALRRNVWRGAPGGDAAALARRVLAEDVALGAQPPERMAAGEVRFGQPGS